MKIKKDDLIFIKRDLERISNISNQLKKKMEGYKDPLDEIFVSTNETKLIKEIDRLRGSLLEQMKNNEYLQKIYKRDIPKSFNNQLKLVIRKIKQKYGVEIKSGDWDGICEIITRTQLKN